jgi:hypothetical protein
LIYSPRINLPGAIFETPNEIQPVPIIPVPVLPESNRIQNMVDGIISDQPILPESKHTILPEEEKPSMIKRIGKMISTSHNKINSLISKTVIQFLLLNEYVGGPRISDSYSN